MTEVNTPDGKITTDLPLEAVKDLELTPEPSKPAEPAKVEEPQKPTAEPKAEEPKAEPAKEPAKEPEAAKPRKASPIANLLEQRHKLETDLATERQAKADLEA